jgi:hypothetical protein
MRDRTAQVSDRPGGVRPGRGRQGFRAGLAAYRLDGKVCEAPEEGTKEGAQITKKGGETLEEGPPYGTLAAWTAKSPFSHPIAPMTERIQ